MYIQFYIHIYILIGICTTTLNKMNRISGAHVDVDVHIQYATLCALLNVIFESDSNRMLSIELNGISPIVTLLQTTSHEHLITMGIKILSNISYNNGYTANCVLLAGGGEVLLEVLESGKLLDTTLHTLLS